MAYSHGRKWNDELTAQKIKEVVDSLRIERMPSRTEMDAVTGNTSLSNRVSKSGGYYGWAEKLNLEVKNSDTKTGKHYEFICEEHIMKNCGIECEQMIQNHPFDILAGSFVKIDVKACNRYYHSKNTYSYTFNFIKNPGDCDVYVCYCVDSDGTIDKVLIIPAIKLRKRQMSIGAESKFDIYKDQWHWINKFDDFYKTL